MMLPYNTDMEPMLLPEFGRHLQGLVDYCVNIPDREERTACAYAIADTMASLFPNLIGENNDYTQIWNNLNILSRFELDIDFPCEVITAEKMNPVPSKIPYSNPDIRLRYYGKNLEKMIEKIAGMEEGQEKNAMIHDIAVQMKRMLTIHNKESVDDKKIAKDLALYSDNKITVDESTFHLPEIRDVVQQSPRQKKKKRK